MKQLKAFMLMGMIFLLAVVGYSASSDYGQNEKDAVVMMSDYSDSYVCEVSGDILEYTPHLGEAPTLELSVAIRYIEMANEVWLLPDKSIKTNNTLYTTALRPNTLKLGTSYTNWSIQSKR